MKPTNKLKISGLALAGLISISLLPSAKAIVLSVEAGGVETGVLYSGPVKFVLSGLDSGTTYSAFRAGAIGNTAGNTNSALGIPAMDVRALPINGGERAPGSIGSEDTFFIGAIERIIADDGSNRTVWTPAVKSDQVRVFAYGATDFFGINTGPAATVTGQTLFGKSLTVDLYESGTFLPSVDFGGTDPAIQRTILTQYPGFTNPPTASVGLPLARFRSQVGFFDTRGGGLETETISNYAFSVGAKGNFEGFLSVVPGIGEGFKFENNGYIGTGLNRADASFNLSTTTLSVSNPWTVSVTGDVFTTVVPEPATTLAGLACLFPILSSALGRRRRA